MRSPIGYEGAAGVPHDGSYIKSYPHFLSYFAEREVLTDVDVVRGAHMVYGWMPTILEINPGVLPVTDLQLAATYLNRARQEALTKADLEALKRLINNSIVGASKLLHFVAPERYAIWDSRVYAFARGQYGSHAAVNSVTNYLGYLQERDKDIADERFPAFHRAVCKKVGYEVSKMRALELIMFLNAPSRKDKSAKESASSAENALAAAEA